jgi:gamma-glutamylcyclotransferase (GGCT)/AIG2-like uncharacterized protein YtfP
MRQVDGMSPRVVERLFSYGTLRLEGVQRASFGRRLAGVEDAMLGYRSRLIKITDPEVIEKSGSNQHPIVEISGNPDDRVPGMVFDITPEELAAADAYEVSDYKRVKVRLASGLEAWVFIKA